MKITVIGNAIVDVLNSTYEGFNETIALTAQ